MLDLVELLESFNRKERFFLIRQALGNSRLSVNFRTKLSIAIGLAVPETSFVAMDYHLDSLAAALYAHQRGNTAGVFNNPERQIIKGHHEDIDLIVAFSNGGQYHIVLVEAKGATGWTNKQMRSKANRLTQIFGPDGDRYSGVVPHFCLSSPRLPQRLKASEWPNWMRSDDGSYIWLDLNFPQSRNKVTRCDAEGNQSAEGDHFRIVRT